MKHQRFHSFLWPVTLGGEIVFLLLYYFHFLPIASSGADLNPAFTFLFSILVFECCHIIGWIFGLLTAIFLFFRHSSITLLHYATVVETIILIPNCLIAILHETAFYYTFLTQNPVPALSTSGCIILFTILYFALRQEK